MIWKAVDAMTCVAEKDKKGVAALTFRVYLGRSPFVKCERHIPQLAICTEAKELLAVI